MILRQPPAFEAEDALGGPRINLDLAKDQPWPVPLAGDVLVLNQPFDIRAAQMQVARDFLKAERAVGHTPGAAAPLPPGRAGAASRSGSALLVLRGPHRGMPVNLVEAAGVVAHQFELRQHVADIPLLFNLLVEEPLEER